MADPKTAEEYNELYQKHTKITGFGLEVTIHMPCPFCAAPDFCVYKIIEVEEALSKPSTCSSCGRSLKTFINEENGRKTLRFVQTGGEPGPDFL